MSFDAPPPLLGRGAAIAFVAGAGWALCLPGLPTLTSASIAAIVSAALAFAPSRARWLALFAFGFAYAAAHAGLAMRARLPEALDGEIATLDLRVVDLPETTGRIRRFTAVATSIGRVRLSSFDAAFDPQVGERFRVEAKLRRPRGLVNPGGFDFERHAAATRLAATGYVRSVDSHLPAERFDATRAALDRFRAAFSAFVVARRGNDDRAAALVRALAVGDTRDVDDRSWAAFRATGTTHLVAISGLHVALVASLGLWLVRLAYAGFPSMALSLPRQRAEAIGTLVFATAYALVAGASLPVLRTVLTIAAALASRWFARRHSPSQALALAAIVLVVVDPLGLLLPGFWLSFAGVAWLLFCLGGRPRVAAWRTVGRAQMAVSLGLAPLTLALFGQLSLVGPLANLAAVPWISFVCVPLSLLALATFAIVPSVADVPIELASMSVQVALDAIGAMARWPHAEWHPVVPGFFAIALGVVGAIWLLAPRGTPGRALGLALILPTALAKDGSPLRGEFDVHVLDVGQGLSVLIRTREHAVLYDAGAADEEGFDLGESVVVPSLRALGVTQLDRFVVSHEDRDHAGGAAAVIAALQPGEVRRNAGRGACLAGEHWTYDGVRFELLHPPRDFPALGNDSSCVLRIASDAGSVLLPGDVGATLEARLVRSGDLAADLVVAPHHGSRTSSSADFVEATGARYVVFSRGYRHHFGHPHREVALRYARAGAIRLDTAIDGALHVAMRNEGITVGKERLEGARWWRETADDDR